MTMKQEKKRIYLRAALALAALLVVLLALDNLSFVPSMLLTVLRKGAIYALVAVSMNLLNGFTGLFSLGQAGFMLLGAYTYAILTIPAASQKSIYQRYANGGIGFSIPELLSKPLGGFGLLLGVVFCLILAGFIAALFAFLIGLPVLKLKSDYLAIATLGFAEIIRAAVVYEGFGPLTNGSNLLYGFTSFASFNLSLGGTTLHLETVMPFLFSGICIAIILLLINSTYGRAFKAIRDDEIAAEAMGINLASHKRMSFIKAVKKSKGMSGKPVTSKPVYGYVMDEDENFIIDEEAAPVVQQIYQLCLAGNGPTKIARMLTEQQIPTPGTLEYQRTGSTRRYHPGYECKWATNTVVHILENREYTGCLVNFKTEKPSYKVKHSIENPVEKQAIFENHHEPIIDKETWERVQELRKQRKRPNRYDEVGLFSGILFCADCGHVLYQQRYQNKDRKQDCYICGSYKKRTRNCTAHFIRTDLLTAGVLANLRQVTEYAAKHESRFVKLLVQQNEIGGKRKTAAAIKQLEQAQERISEISRIIKRLYEDNVNGKISDERFMELSADYEAEQAELKKRAAALQAELDKSQAATVNAEKFMGIVRKHLAFEELTPTLLREMIEKIVVHECSYDENGTRRQDIEIYYSFVGKIDLPE